MIRRSLGILAALLASVGAARGQGPGWETWTTEVPAQATTRDSRPARLPLPEIAPVTHALYATPTPPAPAPNPSPATQPAPTTAPPASGCGPGYSPGIASAPFVCGPDGRVWGNFEWLVWATAGQAVPPLVTTAPAGTPQPIAGVLTALDTRVLYGGRRANNDFRGGFRLNVGGWIDDARTSGIEGDFFVLNTSRQGISVAADPILARPFFDVLADTPAAVLVSYPGLTTGRVDVRAESEVIGGGVSALWNWRCGVCSRVDLVAGYRYLGVSDDLTISQQSTALAAGVVPAGTRYSVFDQFRTANDFNGGLIGVAGERRFGHWYVAGRGTVAFGGVRQVVQIGGGTSITLPGQLPQNFAGGVNALGSNIGTYERTAFAVVPEIGLRLGVQLHRNCRVYFGYNWMYLSDVARAGDQIDGRVNPNFLPPPASPLTGPAVPALGRIRTTDFWVQGVTFGLELRF